MATPSPTPEVIVPAVDAPVLVKTPAAGTVTTVTAPLYQNKFAAALAEIPPTFWGMIIICMGFYMYLRHFPDATVFFVAGTTLLGISKVPIQTHTTTNEGTK